ncbi:neogenin isoform X2 [Bacillus rossius redtenbacheri]|uniref:neogenin isoform X2 n=1 Tax=Bacillus rossius redtenbacheri TaxID=93214 RepID=UPI002FDDB2A5
MKFRIRCVLSFTTWVLVGGISLVLTLGTEGSGQLQFSREPEDAVVPLGSDAALHCTVTSRTDRQPRLRWRTEDGQSLSFIGDQHRSQAANGSLLFSGVVAGLGLEGGYQCVAELEGIGLIASRTARLVIALPELEEEPQDLALLPGQTAYFSCLLGEPAGAAAEVRWLKDGRPLAPDGDRAVLLPSGALEVAAVRPGDEGEYRCNVTGFPSPLLSRPATLSLTSDQGVDIMAPEFVAVPRPASVVQGSTVTLDCAANGNPAPRITWLKDGATLDMSPGGPYRRLGTGSLQISDVRESHAGTYLCRADNSDDFIDATASLDVQVPPWFVRRPADVAGMAGGDAELQCEARGRPEPRVGWLKDGDRLTPNDYMQLVGGHNLRILGLLEQDAGMFQCVAASPAGSVQAPARLSVLLPAPQPLPPPSQVPSAPRQLEAVVVSTRFVTLRWQPPAHPRGLTTYSVFHRQDRSDRERVANTTSEELTVGGLAPGRAYRLRVVGNSAAGAGQSSEELRVVTQPELHVPGPPLALRVAPLSPTELLAEWRPPEAGGGPGLLYKLCYIEGDSAEEHHVETTALRYKLDRLRKYTEYSLWVVATNQNGPGAGSEQVLVRTLSDRPSEPPQNVSVEAVSSTSAVVRWEPPAPGAQNGVVTGYKLRWRRRDRRGRGQTLGADAGQRSLVLTGLERGAQYQLRLWALTANGTGPPTDWHPWETLERDLDESRVPGMPVGLRTRATADSITVMWSPPLDQGVAVRGYTLGWGKGIPDVYTQLLDERQRYYTIASLEPNSEYVISLRANNEMGDGRPVYGQVRTREEQAPEPLVPLIPPVGLRAVVLSSTSVVLYWADTTLPKSQFVTDSRYYVVRYTSSHHSANPRYRYTNATDLNCMIDDLRPNTQYEFTVRLIKGRRESPWSMVVLNMTQEAAPSSQPRDLTVVPVEGMPTTVNLNWQPPRQPNGAITGYVVLYTDDHTRNDREWVVKGIVGDKMTTTVTGLKPDTTYYYKIQARNAKGYGPFSSTVTFTTGPRIGKLFYDSDPLGQDGHGFSQSTIMYVAVGCVLMFVLFGAVGLGVVCCRRRASERSKQGYVKGNLKGKAGIKPPDLWIHHDQMELKALEKTRAECSGSGGGGVPIAVATLPRAGVPQDYEPQPATSSSSLDKHTYVSSYIVPGVVAGTPVPSGVPQTGGGEGVARPVYPRTQYSVSRAHVTLDQAAQTLDATQGGYDTGPSLPGAPGPPPEGKRLGHPLKSFSVPAPPPQSAPGTPQPKHVVRPQGSASPYKKVGGQPATPASGKGRVTSSAATSTDDSRLQASYSTEELNQEMANLEGLMKDLNAITASEFEC